jgi:hypothetical protein
MEIETNKALGSSVDCFQGYADVCICRSQQTLYVECYRENQINSPELLGFWTFSIVRYSMSWKTRRFENCDLFPSLCVGHWTSD